MNEPQAPKFSWDAPHYEHRPKTADWYWVLGILAVVGIVLSVLAHNLLLAFLLALGGTLMAVYAGKDSPIIHIEITQKGIRVNDAIYPYKNIKSFWIYKTKDESYRIILQVERAYLPFFTLPIASEIPLNDLRSFLKLKIEEIEHREPTIDTVMHSTGF